MMQACFFDPFFPDFKAVICGKAAMVAGNSADHCLVWCEQVQLSGEPDVRLWIFGTKSD
jgi:hypothetical protein